MKKSICIAFAVGCALVTVTASATNRMMTVWGEKMTPETAWTEYPRPNLVRGNWRNLDGLWNYAVTPKAAERPARWQGKILVPFCIESTLSGVGRLLQPDETLWYRRTFMADARPDERLLLNFGAVDFRAQVFVNGMEATDVPHEGGNLPFALDITDLVRAGENELVVAAWDPTDKGDQALGKQSLAPAGCSYTRVSGIWQTVWLERVPAAYVAGYEVTTDIDKGEVHVKVLPAGELTGTTAGVSVLDDEKEIAKGQVRAWGEPVTFRIPHAKLWSPDRPNLYGLKITLASPAGKDEVRGYFGMRKIESRKDEKGVWRIYLNNEKTFLLGTLDQGWWPDGLLTPPSEEAMAFDIAFLKRAGFNCLRKHIKVEPLRYYHLCDTMGLLVWQDMVTGGGDPEDRYGRYRRELKGMVDLLRSFPSIAIWVPYNEGWGQPGKQKTDATIAWLRRYDPSRLVDGPSGWVDTGTGDLRDSHVYPGPVLYGPVPDRASVLGEFGGLGYFVKGHTWSGKPWGYVTDDTPEKAFAHYRTLLEKTAVLSSRGLAAAIYTQTSDVEIECNGLMTYDRRVIKHPDAELAKLAAAVYKGTAEPERAVRTVLPTAKASPQDWAYTFAKPVKGWEQPGFDDSAWKRGPGGFGNPGIAEAYPTEVRVRTAWNTPAAWFRRTFESDGKLPDGAFWNVFHDEDCKVCLNGVLVATLDGFTASYEQVEMDMAAVRKALKPGRNVLAVSVVNAGGGAYFDIGIDYYE